MTGRANSFDPGNCPTCGEPLPYSSWRAELLDRAPEIVAAAERPDATPAEQGAAEVWRQYYVEEFGREPNVTLQVIQGGLDESD